MSEQPPSPELAVLAKAMLGPVLSAIAGLVVRWTDDVAKGHQLTWRRLIVETPSAVGLGIMGGGLAAWLQAPPEAGWALAALLGHLGTQGVINTLMRWRGRR